MREFKLVIAIVVMLASVFLVTKVIENVDADEIMIVQHLNGSLDVHTTPGIKWQLLGKLEVYQKLFDSDMGAPVMFNDNGTGTLQGQYQVQLPLDREHLLALYTNYGSQDAIEQSLVHATVNKVIYMTGPLMSSKESSAERKTDLIRYITDQIDHGVYRTTQKTITVEDQMSKEKRTVTVAEISVGLDGKPERQEESVLSKHGIKVVNFAPRQLDYDEVVKKQIAAQQTITMEVQTARAKALEAEQNRITAEATGKALVMTAQYRQEVIKVTAVTLAQQNLEVATLDAKSAEQTKRRDILLGEGEATRKELVMRADGALEKKLEAFVRVSEMYASAIKDYKGSWVPNIVMGGPSGTGNPPGGAALSLVDLLTAKTARDLSLDFKLPGSGNTAQTR